MTSTQIHALPDHRQVRDVRQPQALRYGGERLVRQWEHLTRAAETHGWNIMLFILCWFILLSLSYAFMFRLFDCI